MSADSKSALASAQSAAASASAAATAAGHAAGLLEAVGTTSAGIVDAALADPESAPSVRLSATFAKVIQVVGDGTDKTAAINAALATGVAVGLTKEVRLVGEFAISAPLVISSKTKLDATGATITLAAGSNCNMLRNAAVAATGTRDNGIDVIGGRWIRGTNAGTGINGHTFCFRRVDGLRVRPAQVETGAGKYAVNLGDVTAFEVDHIDFNTTSDGVHVNGPASNGSVHHITGTTHDDSVALTCNDYAAYSDVSGDITSVQIHDVNTISTGANNVKVLAGQGCLVDAIKVAGVRGTHVQSGVWLGDDNGQASTDNGTHGAIRVSDVKTISSAANGAQVFTNLANGAKSLVLSDIVIPAASANTKYGANIGIGPTGVIDSLLVDGIRAEDGWANANPRLVSLIGATGALVRDVEIRTPMATITNGRLLEIAACSVTQARVIGPQLSTSDTTTRWISANTASALGKVVFDGGSIAGGKACVYAEIPTEAVFTGGIAVSGASATMVDTFTTSVVTIENAKSTTNSLVYAESAATSIDLHVSSVASVGGAANMIGNYASMGSKIPIRITRAQRTSQWMKLPQGWDSGWRAAKSSQATTPLSILVSGDSIASGQGASDWLTKGWFGMLRSMLLTSGMGLHSDFYPAATYGVALSGQAGVMPYTAMTGGTTNEAGYGRLYTTASGQNPATTFTLPSNATGFEVVYSDWVSGTWQYAVDGGAATTVTTVGDGNIRNTVIKKIAKQAVTPGTTHTVAIGNASAGNVLNLIGVNVYYGATGVGFARNTYPGMRAADLNTYSGPGYGADGTNSFPNDKILQLQGVNGASPTGFGFPTGAKLAVIAFGVNDCALGAPVKNFTYSIRRQIAALRRGDPNCSIIIMAMCAPDGSTSADNNVGGRAYDYGNYKAAMSNMAEVYGCAYVDIDAKWGQIPVTLGFQPSTNVHPNDAGHADIATVLGSIL